ncbi:mitogen-activated protein kinase kinase kinase 18-like [Typha latifolia]|uniref:mitogen-activated protein kinase kinase kinase 18-like n=1 Tax=Typha latifolia TaxID=4733 RepID=UPI003C2DD4B8
MVGKWYRGPTLGRGASATVSLATMCSSGKVFAVKSASLAHAAILEMEQSILSSLKSSYIISYLGFDTTRELTPNKLCYNLFMEYAPGGSLSSEIKKHGGRLDERTIRFRTYEILCGLAYIHENGVVHCDIKGENVLIGSEGHAKIADFGCSKRVAADADDDGKGGVQLRGTPVFMAPEVARGEEQGTAADIWALGCTVVEMATGRAPWVGVSDPLSVLHHIAFSSDVPEIPSWISEEGRDFLCKCLKRESNERWTADQLLKHPFVASPSNCVLTETSIDDFWVSPKSILDQCLWESLTPMEEEIEEAKDPMERLKLLTSGNFAAPNWTWYENWITVRSDGRESVGGKESRIAVPIGTNSSNGELILSASPMETQDFHRTLHPYSFFNYNDNVERYGKGKELFSCKGELSYCNSNTNLVNISKESSLRLPSGSFHINISPVWLVTFLCFFR